MGVVHTEDPALGHLKVQSVQVDKEFTQLVVLVDQFLHLLKYLNHARVVLTHARVSIQLLPLIKTYTHLKLRGVLQISINMLKFTLIHQNTLYQVTANCPTYQTYKPVKHQPTNKLNSLLFLLNLQLLSLFGKHN